MKKLIVLVGILGSFLSYAQTTHLEFGKVSQAELSMTQYPLDTSADAVVLGDYGDIDYLLYSETNSFRFKRHTRIKILKRSGFDQGDISIPYLSYKNYEKIKSIEVVVFSPDGKSVEMKKGEYFDESVNDYYSVKKIAVPNLEVGSIIDVSYITDTKGYFELPTWYFQQSIPVVHSELILEIPNALTYSMLLQNAYVNEEESTPPKGALLVDYHAKPILKNGITYVVTRWAARDLPGLKPDPFTACIDDYRVKVRFQLNSYIQSTNATKEVTSSWKTVSKELEKSEHFGLQYNNKEYFESFLAEAEKIIPSKATVEQKIIALQNMLLNHIKINAYEGIYVNDKLNDAWKNRRASAAEVNLLMLGILKQLRVEAYPILISTRSKGKPIVEYPLLDQFNHVLILVKDEDKKYLVDVSSTNRAPGYPSQNALTDKGFLLEGTEGKWIDLTLPSSNVTHMLTVVLNEDRTLKGDLAIVLDGYYAETFRTEAAVKGLEKQLFEYLQERFPDAEIRDIVIENQDDTTKPLKIKVNCIIPQVTTTVGDFIYLMPNLFTNYLKSPFTAKERKLPVDLPYPFKEQTIINLQFPEDYILGDFPKTAKVSLPDLDGTFQFQLSPNTNSLQLVSKIQLHKTYFDVHEYESLRLFFETIERKLNEQLVLKKR